ncbi:MAG: hypothetical protein NVS3B10_03440 [Polyangiales bacterium]
MDRFRVTILNIARFTDAIPKEVLLPLLQTLTGVDLMMGLTDAGTRCRGDGERDHHSRLALAVLSMGTLVETSKVAEQMRVALDRFGIAKDSWREVTRINHRWTQKRNDIRVGVAFHYDRDTIDRGLRVLARLNKPIVLLDQLGGLPSSEAGCTVGLAGLDRYDDSVALLAEMRDDMIRVAHETMRAVATVIASYDLPIENVVQGWAIRPWEDGLVHTDSLAMTGMRSAVAAAVLAKRT